MRLYTLTKRQFVLVFAGFFACFFTTMIIGLAGLSFAFSVVYDLAFNYTGPFVILGWR